MTYIPRLTRRRALYVMGGAAGAITLHACTQQASDTSSASPDAAETTAASPSGEPVDATNGSTLWIGYSPLYVALEKGFFEEGGLNLSHNVLSTSGEGNAAFAAGRLDGLCNVTSETVAFATKGQDFKIVQVADSSQGGDGILARNSVGSVEDFKGKEVALEIGGVSHFFFLQVLKEAGLTADDVTITNLSPDAAAAAYQSGRVDVAVTYSPFLKQANDAQSDGRIIYDTTKMPTAIMDVYLFSNQIVEENPQAMQAFVNGIYKAVDFLKTSPDEANAIAGKQLGLTAEEVATELQGVRLIGPEDNVKLLGDLDSSDSIVQHMVDLGTFLKEQEQITEAPTADQIKGFIDSTFVQAAV